MDNTSNNFYITGIQLEVGSQATPFEHRSFGEELALCQRYFQQFAGETGVGSAYTGMAVGHRSDGTKAFFYKQLLGEMRVAPTLTLSGTTGMRVANLVSGTNATSSLAFGNREMGTNGGYFRLDHNSVSGSTGDGCRLDRNNDTSAGITADAEL